MLVQNMPQLRRLNCTSSALRAEGIRAFQPALQSNQTLRELSLWGCNAGDEGIHLIADALVGNTTMEILNLRINNISSTGLADFTRLLVLTQLKKVFIGGNQTAFVDGAFTRSFAHVLSRLQFLKELCLYDCQLGDKGIGLIVDGLVGNTVMEVLNIRQTRITSVGFPDIMRVILSTRLHSVDFVGTDDVDILNDEDATEYFVTTLEHEKSNLQELPNIDEDWFPEGSRAGTYNCIQNCLTRNQQLNRVDLLLAPPPPPSQQQQRHQQQQRNTATMMLKTWHKAITKLAMVPNHAGASAIFKLFQARPQLLETRLKRPASSATAASPAHSPFSQEPKRRRL